MTTSNNPTRRSAQGRVPVDPTKAPDFLASVDDAWVFADRSDDWAERTRTFYLSTFGVVPSLLDLARERRKRALLRRGKLPAPVAEGRSIPTPLPMLGGVSPLREQGRRKHEAKQRQKARREARRAAPETITHTAAA